MKCSIPSAKLDSPSCSNSCLASCATPDNSKRQGVHGVSIWCQKTNLFWVGEAWELCFNYSPRRRRLWKPSCKPPTALWVVNGWLNTSAGITMEVWVSNILWLLVSIKKGNQLLKFLPVLLLYCSVDNTWRRNTSKYHAGAISAC